MNANMISIFNSAAESWLAWMWPMSWQLCILVPAVAALTWLLRHRSARLRYALWLLVPLRLIVPPTLAFATGWGWWLLPASIGESANSTVIVANDSSLPVAASAPAQDHVLIPAKDLEFDSYWPDARSGNSPSADLFERYTQPRQAPPVASSTPTAAPATDKTSLRQTIPVSFAIELSWQVWLMCGWISGVVVMACRFLIGACRARGIIGDSRPWLDSYTASPNDAALQRLIEKCHARVAITRAVAIRQSERADVPMLIGVRRPVIVLPPGTEERLSLEELEAVLIHELEHVVRRDTLVNLAQGVLQMAYFFHPLVWLSNRTINRLREDACDEATVATLEGRRREYGEGIVKVAEMATGRLPHMAVGIAESSGQVKRRLSRILDPRLRFGRRLSWPGLITLIAAAAILLPTAARTSGPVLVETRKALDAQVPNDVVAFAENDEREQKTATKKANDAFIKVHGTILETDDSPAADVTVSAKWYYQGDHKRGEVITDNKGRFELEVPRQRVGGLLIRADAGKGEDQAAIKLPWDPHEVDQLMETGLRLQLQPARRVELHVLDNDRKPVPHAHAGVMAEYDHLEIGTTDAAGHVELLVPEDLKIGFVYAYADDFGFDYRAYVLSREQIPDKTAKAPEFPEGPIELTLEGARPLEVHVVDRNDRPIEGIRVYPWYFEKSDQATINLSSLGEEIETPTDENGVAIIRWIPIWQGRYPVWSNHSDYVHQQFLYDANEGENILSMRLDRLSTLSGRVTYPDGKPAEGIVIDVDGAGRQFNGFRAATTTDEEGRYQLKVSPDMLYLVVAHNDQWAAAPHTGFAIYHGQDRHDLDFRLRPATRLFGRVTIGKDNKPIGGQDILLRQFGAGMNEVTGIEFPKPEQNPQHNDLNIRKPQTSHWPTTDEHGYFEAAVGPGKYVMSGPEQGPTYYFEITDETEREFNFHISRPESGQLTGIVVAGDPAQPVADAKISLVYMSRGQSMSRDPNGDIFDKTDQLGRFSFERRLKECTILAQSEDGSLAGIVTIGPDDESVTVPIRPIAKAKGRLIDGTTGKPLAGHDVAFETNMIFLTDYARLSGFGGRVVTDNEGRFELAPLVVGQSYRLGASEFKPISATTKSNTIRSHVRQITPETSGDIDLGDLKFRGIDETPPAVRAKQIFSRPEPLSDRYHAATKYASLTDRLVPLVFGKPTAELTQQFVSLALNLGYTVWVNTDGDKRLEADELAQKLGVTLSDSRADLFLVLIDGNGKAVESADIPSISVDDQLNPDKITAFLAKQEIKKDAQKLLDDALLRAKAENKRVLVQDCVSGKGYGQSVFLDQTRKLWEKDFVWVRLIRGWENQDTVMNIIRPQLPDNSTPWLGVLDADGKLLVSSYDFWDFNIEIGGSTIQQSKSQFRYMLEKSAIRMTPDDIDALVDALGDDD